MEQINQMENLKYHIEEEVVAPLVAVTDSSHLPYESQRFAHLGSGILFYFWIFFKYLFGGC